MNAAIPTGDKAALMFADALSVERALTEVESRVLQRLVNRDKGAFRRWSEQDDAKLLRMHKAKIRGADIAKTLGRSEDAVFVRLHRLKKAQRVKRHA